MYRLLKVVFGFLVGCVVAVFLPLIPASSLGDPVDNSDSRINAQISDEDVKEIIRIVRHGRVNSVYEVLRYHTRSPLLHISKSTPNWHVYPGPAREIPPKGEITATVGSVCGTLCGSGVTYYLQRVDGAWEIVEVSEWIS